MAIFFFASFWSEKTYRNRKRINVAEQIYGQQKKEHILKQNYYILDIRHCILYIYQCVVVWSFSHPVLPNEQVSLDHKIPHHRTAVLLLNREVDHVNETKVKASPSCIVRTKIQMCIMHFTIYIFLSLIKVYNIHRLPLMP